MLAIYDLCAVLTPCGPLKALVNLMQHEDAPEMVRAVRTITILVVTVRMIHHCILNHDFLLVI
jgi:hypothetical protein